MKSIWKLVVLLAAVALVASLSCMVTGHLWPQRAETPSANIHRWIHKQLELTPEQDKALDAQEEQFTAQKKALSAKLRQANADLATAIQQDKDYSLRVADAVEKIHHAQSNLEKVTLEHIFAMKGVLTPEQFDKLLKLTGDALNEPFEF